MLDGLPVLDLTDHRGQVGPWLLAELGAQVVRVVRPDGRAPGCDEWVHDGRDLADEVYGAGKVAVSLDPASADDRARLRALVADASVVVDAGPPGRLAAYGIDRRRLIELNPTVVAVLVTVLTQDAPSGY